MDLTTNLKNSGFLLADTSEEDLEAFILVEKVSHNKYVAEHKEFFGEWNEEILKNAFYKKREMTFFKKILWNDEIAGFCAYDQKEDKIDEVFIRVINKMQGKGIGTWFLSSLKAISRKYAIPVFLVVIKTNPAQNLYYKQGFECYKEQDVFLFMKYMEK